MSSRRFLSSRTSRLLLAAAATGGGLALFLTQARPGELAAGVRALPPSAGAAALAAGLAGLGLTALRWRWLLAAAGVEASVPRLFAALVTGAAANNLVPARGGDALRVESVRQQTGAARLAVAGTLLAERLLDGFVLALWIVVGAVLTGAGGGTLLAGGALLALTVAGGAAAALAVARPERARAAAHVVVRPLPARWRGPVERGLASLVEGLSIFRSGRIGWLALGGSAAIWLADVVMYGALAHGFDLELGPGSILLLVGVGNLALAVPAAAAGIGTFELVTLAGARGVGAVGSSVAAFVLAVHATIVLPATVLGFLMSRAALPAAFGTRSRATAGRDASRDLVPGHGCAAPAGG
jgi:hypothetical protein